jgi:uncharacterized protein
MYHRIVEDIIRDRHFKMMKKVYHHRDSVYDHSLRVSYLSYKLAKKLHLDYVSAARGGLLHDFFLYDWRKEGKRRRKKFFEKHGFTHAAISLGNAEKHFKLNDKERDIILKHMFPLNIAPPRTAESWLVMFVDKYVAARDYLV